MKRWIAILALIAVLFSVAACAKQGAAQDEMNVKHDEIVTKATKQLKKHWKEVYRDSKSEPADGYFEIKNTRVITIKDNEIDLFRDVAYIVEYELFTDYMGSAPYYEDCSIHNNVVVRKDGSMEVTSNLIRNYRSKTYQNDYSGFMESIDDYGGYYNCVEKLKK